MTYIERPLRAALAIVLLTVGWGSGLRGAPAARASRPHTTIPAARPLVRKVAVCVATAFERGGRCTGAVRRGMLDGGRRPATLVFAHLVPASLGRVPRARARLRANTWSPTNPMPGGRQYHTATLLPNGLVLVTGGCCVPNLNPFTALPTAALYDPRTGTWRPTGRMHSAREHHTATLLSDGTVLVAGGDSGQFGVFQTTAETYDLATGTWTSTGPMAFGSANATATLLPDGKVLVAGGSAYSGDLNGAQLYDPTPRTWTATGAMATARGHAMAILLPGGRVLVTGGGGYQGDGPSAGGADLSSAELYEPESGTWTPTGAMTAPRAGATATLLRDGRVLVAGGEAGGSAAVATAELYDPGTGRWSVTGGMSLQRSGHTATLLPDGRVLVAGGALAFPALGAHGQAVTAVYAASAELYDPRSGDWAAVSRMSTQRFGQTATVLPTGQVLVAGGCNAILACIPTSPLGGPTPFPDPLPSAELFTPGPGPLANLSTSAQGFGAIAVGATSLSHTVTLTNKGALTLTVGTVTVTGGGAAAFHVAGTCAGATVAPGGTCAVEVSFTPGAPGYATAHLSTGDTAPGSPQQVALSGSGLAPRAWSRTGSMTVSRYVHTATRLLSGQILVAGGLTCSSLSVCDPSNTAELYDAPTGTWSLTTGMTSQRAGHTATLLSTGAVLVAGGFISNSIASADIYDPTTKTWTPTASMSVPRGDHTATLLADGRVLVAGGANHVANNGVTFDSAALYDPGQGTWTATGAMTSPRDQHTATLLQDGKVLIAGGEPCGAFGCQTLASAELYDPRIGVFTATGSMQNARKLHTATLLPDGRVLVVGGDCCGTAELYDPHSGTWSPTGSPAGLGCCTTATLLTSGQVLTTGSSGAALYDPGQGTWTATAPLATSRNYPASATLLADGTVLVVGGNYGFPLSITFEGAELYQP